MLALGFKEFGTLNNQEVRELKRENVECELTFAGFVVISCPMKPDSKNVIKELIQSSHKVVMITGDNPLTACHVAKELRFTKKKLLVLCTVHENGDKWHWVSVDGETVLSLDSELKTMLTDFDICITGEGLQYLKEYRYEYMIQILPRLTVCARFAPKQKEYVITTLKQLGYCTLMCGDGTNDVGALKHANVGVSLLSKVPLKRNNTVNSGTGIVENAASSITGPATVFNQRSNNRNNQSHPERSLQQRREHLVQTQARLQTVLREIDEEQVSVVKLGDASIAAPFTSKSSSILCGKFCSCFGNILKTKLILFVFSQSYY